MGVYRGSIHDELVDGALSLRAFLHCTVLRDNATKLEKTRLPANIITFYVNQTDTSGKPLFLMAYNSLNQQPLH